MNLEERFAKSRGHESSIHSFPFQKTGLKSRHSRHLPPARKNEFLVMMILMICRLSQFQVLLLVDDRKWWLACVLQLHPDNETQVRVTLLHPPGPSNSFRYPTSEHIVMVTTRDILTVVDPRTRTRRVYTLSKKEIKAATDKLVQVQRAIGYYFCALI